MARTPPPVPGNRTPVPVRGRRGPREVLLALVAALALLCLVVGVPLALATLVGWPLPRTAPSLDMLTEEIDTGTFVRVLAVLVWVAWAQFTACVLVEVWAAVSGVGIPRRVPGAGPSQLLARQLVGAVLLLTSAAASLTPGLSQWGTGHEAPGQGRVVAEAQLLPGAGPAAAPGASAADDRKVDPADAGDAGLHTLAGGEGEAADTLYYRVQPPEGRHHDTLWGIAERHLGEGTRYKEIYQLNKDRLQPDGSRLTEASLVRPGWILQMPADAQGGELVTLPGEESAADESRAFDRYAATGDATGDAAGADASEASAGPPEAGRADERPAPGAKGTEGAEPVGAGGRAADPAASAQPPSAGEADADAADGLPDALVAAPLLAAGLLMALGRSRRTALWQAAAGTLPRSVADDLAPRSPRGRDARDALLVGAAPEQVVFLDRALRLLSAALAGEGRTLPAVYAAWLGPAALHLQLAGPVGRPPAPWTQGPDQTYWTVERAQLPDDTGAAPDAEAPYPGLVSLGMREELRLLLNLEAVPGIVAVRGAPADREAVLSSIAAELATSGWSDRMTVTLVGFAPELTALAPTRVRHLDDIAGLLEVMETETGLRRGALRHSGHESLLSGRTGPARQQQWAPHLVVVGATPTDEESERLAALAAASDRLGIGYLLGTERAEAPGVAWEFRIAPDGTLSEPEMGLTLAAQRLPAARRAAVVELFTALTAPDAAPAPVGGPTVDLGRGRPGVYVRMLGGLEISGLEAPEAERAARLREALALLSLHREGVHPRVLGAALWPRGGTDELRDALVERLARWLGADGAGRPRLLAEADGRLALSADVLSDWDVLRTLHHQVLVSENPTEAGRPADRMRKLTDALALARGALLAEQRAEGAGFGWLEHEIVDAQYPLLVAEIALTLAGEHRAAGEGESAYAAVRSALAAAPTDERLWNELLRSAHATGRAEWLTGAVDWLVAHHGQLFGPATPLPAQTEALLDELLPTWRESAPTPG
ncbi:DNA-binding transcriptional activator of the SARP family [Streptomyces zhaozhouensis]|uniref:DNA-binding transcriptional activator of the SARP family n=1 Tax=Streptomyces zhaozhouensis TaxID=1300267 RepID=A0A286E4I9_9ACTN|nr:LysM domain-containing protein [Streptomyces zhaozhouensis]SOD65825.1 DNA-binding transcriptional activator of the SARP family [Streptomyces zhaozhouensis]